MKLLRLLLFPVVPIYYIITWLRNRLYDLGWKASTAFPFPVICVGNLSTGGTGKTPMIEYLVRLLKDDYKLATLSRGYGRATKGFRLAGAQDTAATMGDEPFQFYNKFKPELAVAADGDRVRGINQLVLKVAPEVILLDDAFQHRRVKAGFNILLTTYHDLYVDDFVLPSGNLREPVSGAKRAQIIVVTKCPETLSEQERAGVVNLLKPQKQQQVFFSFITYAEHVYSENASLPLKTLRPFTLVTGIANPKPLLAFLKQAGLSFRHHAFKDHHVFSEQDVAGILEDSTCIVATEKDYMRLMQFEQLKDKLFYLPITVGFYEQTAFNNAIARFVSGD